MSLLAMKPILETIPDEIKLGILKHYFDLRNGLHSERYPVLKQIRVDTVSCVPGIGRLIPEALYKNNTLVIKPSIIVSKIDDQTSQDVSTIKYPPPHLNSYVKHLEFRFRTVIPTSTISLYQSQIEWLKKLADGDLGFGRLKSIRIIFPGPRWKSSRGSPLDKFLAELETVGRIAFPVQKLDIEFDPTLELPGFVPCEGHPTYLCMMAHKIGALLTTTSAVASSQ